MCIGDTRGGCRSETTNGGMANLQAGVYSLQAMGHLVTLFVDEESEGRIRTMLLQTFKHNILVCALWACMCCEHVCVVSMCVLWAACVVSMCVL